MTFLNTLAITGGLALYSLVSGTAAFAETTTEDPMAESQAFLASKTSMAEATVTAETAAGGKVSAIEYQLGENSAPDIILADVTLADGSQKSVAINPDDGKVLKIAVVDEENGAETQDSGDAETGESANN